MTDFRMVQGFEDVWRPPVRRRVRRPETVLSSLGDGGGEAARARLARIVRRAPEVMVKVTGRVRDASHLRAHLEYISRNGVVDLEGPDGISILGAREVRETADDWSALALADRRRRVSTPFTVSVMLSMPAGTDAAVVRDAGREFAGATFAPTFDYVFALHTDAAHPHLHFAVRALGRAGERLNPKKADLEAWRQTFAQALRDRGVDAEATPRRTRGVTLKAERQPIRKLRERHAAGQGAPSRVRRSALAAAVRLAASKTVEPEPWVRIPVIVGTHSTRWWAPIPRDRGRRIRPTSA
ncbi:MAG: hypothetical protein DI570_08935, partial [Phenylobacterium zucineum]